eukprot:TRINITY_DN11586_c0_g1_i1.p1 TRINITY_DN11586_c0_g1~~TRINITY_DN11586_c0_g1_i1.p1  ORF type:complete len:303 (+),score=26.90 TRINITY_DN11586_c0_g1_i1:15-923(+)
MKRKHDQSFEPFNQYKAVPTNTNPRTTLITLIPEVMDLIVRNLPFGSLKNMYLSSSHFNNLPDIIYGNAKFVYSNTFHLRCSNLAFQNNHFWYNLLCQRSLTTLFDGTCTLNLPDNFTEKDVSELKKQYDEFVHRCYVSTTFKKYGGPLTGLDNLLNSTEYLQIKDSTNLADYFLSDSRKYVWRCYSPVYGVKLIFSFEHYKSGDKEMAEGPCYIKVTCKHAPCNPVEVTIYGLNGICVENLNILSNLLCGNESNKSIALVNRYVVLCCFAPYPKSIYLKNGLSNADLTDLEELINYWTFRQ